MVERPTKWSNFYVSFNSVLCASSRLWVLLVTASCFGVDSLEMDKRATNSIAKDDNPMMSDEHNDVEEQYRENSGPYFSFST